MQALMGERFGWRMGPPVPAAAGLFIIALLCCTVPISGCALFRESESARQARLLTEGDALAAALVASAPAPLAPGALRVRLAFGAGADLDLYVTDPLQETVYFANNPSRAGGRLERDLRCDDSAPRIETVTFPDPHPGVYRVGVDFPESCERSRDPVAFAVVVEQDGRVLAEQRSGIMPLYFAPIVLETRAE